MDERLGRWNFGLLFVGFNLTFFPMHQLGLQGMPRRVYTYPAEMGWQTLNVVASAGAAVVAAGMLVFFFNVWRSARRGVPAGADPWGAGTLEWATSSPPNAGNFAAVPVVHHREPLWAPSQQPTHVSGLAVNRREVLATTVIEAHPDHRVAFPEPTPWPFAGAVATTGLFVGSIFTPWAVVWGLIPVAAMLTLWFWPPRRKAAADLALERAP